MSRWIMGVDFSVTAAGMVAAPLDYDGTWSLLQMRMTGEKLRRDATDVERARRTEALAKSLVSFARMHDVEVAFFESYAFRQNVAAHTLAEAAGVARLELVRAGVEIRTAPMAGARKLLLGKLPRQDVKGAVYALLRKVGAPVDTFDLADAFTCLNWGMSELGGFAFAQEAA